MYAQEDFALLFRIAKSYYIDRLSQEQIARMESVSRPHVSRLLVKAREYGMVKVSIEMPRIAQMPAIANELKQKLDLKDVLIACVPSETASSQAKISRAIATIAAAHLPELLSDVSLVGIGWGYTIYQTSLLLDTRLDRPDMSIIPLLGLSGNHTSFLRINIIANRFDEKWGTSSIYTVMPIMREKRQGLSLEEEKSYRQLLAKWDQLEAAIIGLGPAPQEDSPLLPEASIEYNQQLMESGTVGDILANFFYEDGTVFDTSQYHFQISLPIERLKRMKKVICLAGGINKVQGIIAAARNRFFNILITDINTAELMLMRLPKEGNS